MSLRPEAAAATLHAADTHIVQVQKENFPATQHLSCYFTRGSECHLLVWWIWLLQVSAMGTRATRKYWCFFFSGAAAQLTCRQGKMRLGLWRLQRQQLLRSSSDIDFLLRSRISQWNSDTWPDKAAGSECPYCSAATHLWSLYCYVSFSLVLIHTKDNQLLKTLFVIQKHKDVITAMPGLRAQVIHQSFINPLLPFINLDNMVFMNLL